MTFRLIAIAASIGVPAAAGQDIPLVAPELLATFGDASSVGVDPAGRIYVADPGAHVVYILNRDGKGIYVLGGPGQEEGEFDEPRGVDPTNGLAIVVADAGNSRLQRFTRTYQLIETIPLYGVGPDPVGAAGPGRPNDSGVAGRRRTGRPIAVAVSESNEIFAIDEEQSAVAKWNRSRNFEGFIGAGDDYGRLTEPVDVELLGDFLMVADRRQRTILVYDHFGGYVSSYGGGELHDLSGLSSAGDLLIAAFGARVAFFSASGVLLATFVLPDRSPVRDVAWLDNRLLVLTADSLFSFGSHDFTLLGEGRVLTGD